MARIPRDCQELIQTLQRRYRDEWSRAEALRAELDHIRRSRLWPLFAWLRRVRATIGRAFLPDLAHRAKTHGESQAGKPDLLDDCHCPPAGQVSIIIPFKDRLGLLRNCMHGIWRSRYRDFEVILVDNGSTDPRMLRYLDHLRARRRFRIVTCPEPFNFARLCNRGAAVARGDWLLFLNNDTEVLIADWLERMLEVAGHPRVGIVGATLLHADGTLQHTGIFSTPEGYWTHRYENQPACFEGDDDELGHIRAVPAVTGACLLIGRRTFEDLGGFDVRFPSDYNDVDLCRRARERGLLVAVTPHARLTHFGGLSRGLSACPDFTTSST
jgi:O-antigen biosynthesis protein